MSRLAIWGEAVQRKIDRIGRVTSRPRLSLPQPHAVARRSPAMKREETARISELGESDA
jgi:hypothetical protein